MTTYRYPGAVLFRDYARTMVGFGLSGGILAVVETSRMTAAILAVFTTLFALFGLRTLVRNFTCVGLTDEGISIRGIWRRTLNWDDLRAVTLRYFSTRRDHGDGWMQLVIKGSRKSVRLDSTLEGFSIVAARANQAARAHGIQLSPSTLANFASLGTAPMKRHDKNV